MKQRKTRRILLVVSRHSLLALVMVLFAIAPGCSTHKRTAYTYRAISYQISETSPLPFYTLYQHGYDSLKVYFSIPKRTRTTTSGLASGSGYVLHYQLDKPSESKAVLDSATLFIVPDTTLLPGDMLTGNLTLFTGEATGKRLQLTLTDLDRQSKHEYQYLLPPAWPPGNTHYLVTSKASLPLNPLIINVDDTLTIQSSIVSDQKVQVRYYRDRFPLAFPPFANVLPQRFSYDADSIFDLRFSSGTTGPLRFRQPGIYHLIADTATRQGFTMLVREYPFPWIFRPGQMVEPLRYITTQKEYQEIEQAANKKEAVDAFWVAQTDNELRASRLIREYYQRVEKANYLFTSYQDGWKTDRGMVYIVYGPPGVVERTDEAEVWTYGESKNLLSLTFVFVKMQNPFTDNDFVLDRNLNYKTGWHQMINSWRR